MTKLMEKIYLPELNRLKDLAENIPNTRMMAIGKITALIMLNMRYERIAVDKNLEEHPYGLVSNLIREVSSFLASWRETAFIEEPSAPMERSKASLEEDHEKLFQQLWVRFSAEEYQKRIERYVHRLRINGLAGTWLKGRRCIDFGCGHGNFAHALIREGAASVYGIDFGRASIDYALQARDRLGIGPDKIEFRLESVYKVSKENEIFDFAIQNGVFHHLEDEDAAIREACRVLKRGGWFWYYTDGSGGISYDLWDASVHILRNIPQELMIDYLTYLNIETGKRYHLGDGLNAVYRHTTWSELTGRLSRYGFGNFRRLTGGFPTDFDHDTIAADKYGQEKFGEGDLRVLAQKLP